MLYDILISLSLGLSTPLTAACVIPLYPAYLSYLASRFDDESKKRHIQLSGLFASLGVVTFFITAGLLVTTIFQRSLDTVVEHVSQTAFVLLAIISIILLFDWSPSTSWSFSGTRFNNPYVEAFSYGFAFGAIVLPCNPGFIAAFFARSLLIESPVANILNVASFGIGIGIPLIVLAIASAQWRSTIIGFVTEYKKSINRAAGSIMLFISLYYLIYVFPLL